MTNWFVNKHLGYEKRNEISCCFSHRRVNTGLLLQYARDDDNNDSSNDGHDGAAPTAANANDDDDNAHGYQLLR